MNLKLCTVAFEINMQLTVEQLSSISNGIQFSGPPITPRVRRQIDSLPPPSMNVSTSVVEDVLQNTNITGLIFAYYSNSSLFPLSLTNRTIATSVIGATFSDESANFNIAENVTLNFNLPTPVNLSNYISNHESNSSLFFLSLTSLSLRLLRLDVYLGTLLMEV